MVDRDSACSFVSLNLGGVFVCDARNCYRCSQDERGNLLKQHIDAGRETKRSRCGRVEDGGIVVCNKTGMRLKGLFGSVLRNNRHRTSTMYGSGRQVREADGR